MPKKITVKQNDPPIPAEIMADAIINIARAMREINNSRLKRETIVALIADNSKVAKTTIRLVLNNLDDLEDLFLKPKVSRPR